MLGSPQLKWWRGTGSSFIGTAQWTRSYETYWPSFRTWMNQSGKRRTLPAWSASTQRQSAARSKCSLGILSLPRVEPPTMQDAPSEISAAADPPAYGRALGLVKGQPYLAYCRPLISTRPQAAGAAAPKSAQKTSVNDDPGDALADRSSRVLKLENLVLEVHHESGTPASNPQAAGRRSSWTGKAGRCSGCSPPRP
jgi:hypothetical protein